MQAINNRKGSSQGGKIYKKKRGICESELNLHVVKSLVGLPSIHAVGFVGVVVGWTRSGVGLIDGVLRGGFVGHPVVPGEYQRKIHFKPYVNI